MNYLRLPKNIKVCPECGTNLIITAKHCAICGYAFADADLQPVKEAGKATAKSLLSPVLNRLLILLGLIAVILVMSNLLVYGLEKRTETKARVAAQQATATYIATTYVSPTPVPTITFTPAPPTETPLVDIEYEVLPGDSCLSIVTKFNIDLDSLLRKNRDLDCNLLSLGTVLKVPQPTPTPVPTSTETPKAK